MDSSDQLSYSILSKCTKHSMKRAFGLEIVQQLLDIIWIIQEVSDELERW